MVTDQNPVKLAKSIIQERLLDHLPDEIPYSIQVVSLSLFAINFQIRNLFSGCRVLYKTKLLFKKQNFYLKYKV